MSTNYQFGKTHRAPRIAVFGEWGTSNLGDWAIHEGVTRFFSEYTSKVDTYQFGAMQPFEQESLAVITNITSNERSGFESMAGRLISNSAFRIIKRSVRGLRQEYLVRRLMPRLALADIICVGGGALLTDSNCHFPQSLSAIARAAELLHKPLWCLGCSAEGEWSLRGKDMIMQFLSRCELIATRDRETANNITQLTGRPVPVFGDFALPIVPRKETEIVRQREYTLGINISHIPEPWSKYQKNYEDLLVMLARQFLSGGADTRQILLFTTGTPEDDIPLYRMYERLNSHQAEIRKPNNLNELKGLIEESEIVMATRLHAAILGLSKGRPVIGVSPSIKISNFFSTIGLEKFHFPVPGTSLERLMSALGQREDLINQWCVIDQSELIQTRRTVISSLSSVGNGRVTS